MLFGRLEDTALVQADLLPAFQEYVGAYLDLIGSTSSSSSFTTPSATSSSSSSASSMSTPEAAVRARQAEYDQYNADRDPAHALFKSYFGDEWADDFVHDFLFTLADPEKTVHNPPQFGNGGGGGGGGEGGQPQQGQQH